MMRILKNTLGWFRHRPAAVLLLIFIFHAITNIVVISLDRAPLITDEALYFNSCWHVLEEIAKGNFGALFTFSNPYPPLRWIVSLPFYLVFGYSPDVALLSTLSASLVLIPSVYHIGKEMQDSDTGLLAAALTVLLPGVFAFSRTYFPEPALTAAVALSLALMLKTRGFSHRGYTFAFGLSIALGLLTKESYPLFILGPFLLYLYQSYGRMGRISKKALGECLQWGVWLLFSVLLGLLIASLWYVPNLEEVIQRVKSHTVEGFSSGFDIFSNTDILFFIRDLYSAQLGRFFFVAALASLVYLLWIRHRAAMPLFLWFILPCIFFTVSDNFNRLLYGRHVIGYLPAFALLISIGCMNLRSRQKHAAVLIVLLAGLFQFFALSFSYVPMDSPCREHTGMFRPDPRDWQRYEFVSVLNSLVENRPDPRVTFVGMPVYDCPTIEYLQHMNLLVPFINGVCGIDLLEIHLSAQFGDAKICFDEKDCRELSPELHEEALTSSDVVVIKEGIERPTDSPLARQEYNHFLRAWNLTAQSFRHTKTIVFPDKERVSVYVKNDNED